MPYREFVPPAALRCFVERGWTNDTLGAVDVLPDGCMDLMRVDDRVVVAGPDTTAVNARGAARYAGLRFRPGVLPRLLGVPASELTGQRVALSEVCQVPRAPRGLLALTVALAAQSERRPAQWSIPALHHVTAQLETGAPVTAVAADIGWSPRTLQRQCAASYGYGPATLRRILRFRRAVTLLRSGHSAADVAMSAGYADQSHLNRDVREFAARTPSELVHRAAYRSTEVPSGSVTVA